MSSWIIPKVTDVHEVTRGNQLIPIDALWYIYGHGRNSWYHVSINQPCYVAVRHQWRYTATHIHAWMHTYKIVTDMWNIQWSSYILSTGFAELALNGEWKTLKGNWLSLGLYSHEPFKRNTAKLVEKYDHYNGPYVKLWNANPRWRAKRSRHSRPMRNPQF